MDGMGIAIAFALTGVPAFFIARSLQRAGGPVNSALSRLMRIVGLLLLGGALGMLWADGDSTRILAVALGMALLVNGVAVMMLVTVVRARRRNDRR